MHVVSIIVWAGTHTIMISNLTRLLLGYIYVKFSRKTIRFDLARFKMIIIILFLDLKISS